METQPRVLVAEDNRVMANVIGFNLTQAGFSVTLAHDGREAVRQVENNDFHVVITDYQMPWVSGEELCRHIRCELGNDQLPLILVSAKVFELDTGSLSQELGLHRIVFKPFSPREIVEAATAAISTAPLT